MPIFKCTQFFELKTYGWTESYFADAPYYATAMARLHQLSLKRAPMLGEQTKLLYERVSEEGVFRDVLLQRSNLSGTVGQGSDAPTTALLVKVGIGGPNGYSNRFLRGNWDSIVQTGGLYTPNPAFSPLFGAWAAYLIANFKFARRKLVAEYSANVTGVATNADGTVSVTVGVSPPVKFNEGAWSLRGSGFLTAKQLNGGHVFRLVAPGGTVWRTTKPLLINPWIAGGTLTFQGQEVLGITEAFIERVTERKAGRPSYQSVGRRRAR